MSEFPNILDFYTVYTVEDEKAHEPHTQSYVTWKILSQCLLLF